MGDARKGPMPKGRRPGQEWVESNNGDREGSIQSRACMVDERGERICNHCQSRGSSLSLLALPPGPV